MKIVVCDDIDGAFQRSGELARLEESALRVYDTIEETRSGANRAAPRRPGCCRDQRPYRL